MNISNQIECNYSYIQGAKNLSIYWKRKSIASPITIFIPHFLSADFAFASSPPAHDHAIPRPTIARTQMRSTIFTKYLIIVANMVWKLQSQGCTVHLYFLFSIGTESGHAPALETLSVGGHIPHAHISPHCSQLQSAPGIISDV